MSLPTRAATSSTPGPPASLVSQAGAPPPSHVPYVDQVSSGELSLSLLQTPFIASAALLRLFHPTYTLFFAPLPPSIVLKRDHKLNLSTLPRPFTCSPTGPPLLLSLTRAHYCFLGLSCLFPPVHTSTCQGSLQLAPDFHRNALCHFRTPKSMETPALLLLVPTEARMDSELVLDIKPSPGDCLPYLLHTSLFSHYPRAYLAPPAHTVAPHFLMQYRGLDSSSVPC